MRWGEALLAMIRPALIMGPLLGGLGGVLIVLAGMIYDGNAGAFAAIFLFAFFGLILGLVVATPLCFVVGAVLLRLSDGNGAWLSRTRWLLVGAPVGGLFGLIFGVLVDNAETLLLLPLLFGFLGLLGAVGSHRLLQQRIARLRQVDAEVFA